MKQEFEYRILFLVFFIKQVELKRNIEVNICRYRIVKMDKANI